MRAAARSFLMAIGLILAGTAPSFAQEAIDLRYRFVLQGKGAGPSGALWLYHYSWYGLAKFKLATIERGRARLRLSEARLWSEIQPHPNTEAYVLVLECPGRRWYRTPDLDPATLLRDLPTRLNALGAARPSPRGETALVLPASARRRITLEHEDGRPAVDLDVPVSIYLYDRNHCGRHTGLDLGTVRTDAAGTVEIAAPPVPLYLNVRFYERRGEGPAGAAYWAKTGLKTGAERDVVLRRAWDLPEEHLELHAHGPDGSPLAGATVVQAIRTTECGAWSGPVGVTDATGVARVQIAPATTERLWLEKDGRTRPLSIEELRVLFSQRRITLRW